MALKFGYWMPLGSGGFVISNIKQRTDWSLDYNAKLAQTAEDLGFEYGLAPARFLASHGWELQQEAITCTAVLAAQTKKLKLISAIHTGFWHPAMVAKMLATIDVYSGGRAAIKVLTGWFKEEFRAFGEPWLEHDERYRRSEEFIQILKGFWTQERFTFKGDFYRINEGWLKPRPVSAPEVFQGGNSKAARRMAAKYSDWYFINGNTVEGVKEQIDEVRALAAAEGRTVKFGLNGFVIQRPTEAEALEQLEAIIAGADPEIVRAFGEQVKNAGQSNSREDRHVGKLGLRQFGPAQRWLQDPAVRPSRIDRRADSRLRSHRRRLDPLRLSSLHRRVAGLRSRSHPAIAEAKKQNLQYASGT